jgi:hypothetical protein
MTDRRTFGFTVAATLTVLLCGLAVAGLSHQPRPAQHLFRSGVETSIPVPPTAVVGCILAEQGRWQVVTPMPTCPIRAAPRLSGIAP